MREGEREGEMIMAVIHMDDSHITYRCEDVVTSHGAA
jgi:hypothetical protein